MYRQKPQINTPMEAFDELADVRMTLSGLAPLVLALSFSDISNPKALELISCILDYCAYTADEACELAYRERTSTTLPPLCQHDTSTD